jgi:hypothetical protein
MKVVIEVSSIKRICRPDTEVLPIDNPFNNLKFIELNSLIPFIDCNKTVIEKYSRNPTSNNPKIYGDLF